MEKDKQKKGFFRKMRFKYRLVFLNEHTYEEKFAMRLSRLNVFLMLIALSLFLIVITIFLIAFTPLRNYIPGYMDPEIPRKVYDLQIKADSIEDQLMVKDIYIENIKMILEGREIPELEQMVNDSSINYDTISLQRSREDSILRAEFEAREEYELSYNAYESFLSNGSSVSNLKFFVPLEGIITNRFNPISGHNGIDIVSDRNDAVKATLDGIVVLTGWTIETGHIMLIQHHQNLISVYKHNSVILKQEGSVVKAGEPIAIVGESGELSTGPHLHFELWNNGNPVNPEEYIAF